ncbi:hypothetical protein L226DRAFT_575588 [Lentinus tigrinus ALCF2SS1-7]|uniref:uncharacterized protein n=1 Tax=Lentinus tigrinus ALCF2SS1-7 TaxID=1328758 RepID=UPI001165CD07|nr:hypothetical protein L226DRAFT_575588 [Lentinus tigrinus ALCF2SS1-7]
MSNFTKSQNLSPRLLLGIPPRSVRQATPSPPHTSLSLLPPNWAIFERLIRDMISLVAAFAALVVQSSLVGSQNTTAICEPGFEWMFNSMGQSPCLVTAWLWSPCYALSQDIVSKLDSGFVYQGPVSPSSSNKCLCNTVTYSTLAACAVCQGRGLAIYSWPQYQANCSVGVAQDAYPFSIPGGTAVPAWAYLDVVKNGTFNVDAAEALASTDPPESTAPVLSSTSTSATPTSSSSVTASGSPPSESSSTSSSEHTSPASPPPSTSSHSNVGAIVGGVIGGIGGALIIGAAIFFGLRHRNKTHAPPSHFDRTPAMAEAAPFVVTDPFMTPRTPGAMPEAAPVLYDPNDPSTFPSQEPYGVSTVDSNSLQAPGSHATYSHTGSVNMTVASNPTFTGKPEL